VRYEVNAAMFLTIQMFCDIPVLGLLDPKEGGATTL
jgi:hypothetical protein